MTFNFSKVEGLVYFGPIFMDASEALSALEERRLELFSASEALVAAADEAGEDLDEEALAAIEANRHEVERLDRQIEARKAITPQAAGRKTAPEAKGGKIEGGAHKVAPTPKADSRTGGFKHLGEFASTVKAAASRDESSFNRLVAMNEGVGEDGGFIVPPEFREGIMKVVEGEDSLLSRTDSSTTSKNAVTHPKDETTPWGTAGIRAYWEGEASSVTAAGGKFQGDTLRLNKLFARVDVTDELLEDAPQLDNYLRVKAPEVMTSVINTAIIRGNGVGKPLGILNSPALVSVADETSQPADTVHHRNIVAMWARMYAPCRARAVWLINQDVEPSLNLMSFKDKDTNPVPVYLPAGSIAGMPYATIYGRPVIPVQAASTVGDVGDVILADLSKYRTLTKAGGTRVDTSIHLKFDTDETVFRFIFRLAGQPWWSAPITPENSANTLSPFVAIATRT